MKTVLLSIFPEFADKKAALLNLNDIAESKRLDRLGKSRFLQPELTDRFLAAAHRKLGADYSFGGYLEDRRDLWNGSYMSQDKAVHLGIDINVPDGTGVTVVHSSKIVGKVFDPEQDGGWGSVVFFELDKPIGDITHYLYAHLAKDSIDLPVGMHVNPGDIVAAVGKHHENGGWYEHLHVQAFTIDAWKSFGTDLSKFDGYDHAQAKKVHPLFPNPTPLLIP